MVTASIILNKLSDKDFFDCCCKEAGLFIVTVNNDFRIVATHIDPSVACGDSSPARGAFNGKGSPIGVYFKARSAGGVK
jgi:hypothetical protein